MEISIKRGDWMNICVERWEWIGMLVCDNGWKVREREGVGEEVR